MVSVYQATESKGKREEREATLRGGDDGANHGKQKVEKSDRWADGSESRGPSPPVYMSAERVAVEGSNRVHSADKGFSDFSLRWCIWTRLTCMSMN